MPALVVLAKLRHRILANGSLRITPAYAYIFVQDLYQDAPSDTDTLNLQECDDKMLGHGSAVSWIGRYSYDNN